jgi:hypothetical protein
MKDVGQIVLGVGFLLFLGIFCLWHAWRDTEWFFKNSKAAFWVDLLGREGARWFYGSLGVFILLLMLVGLLGGMM